MQTGEKTITFIQFILLIFGIQIGIGILSIPQDLAEKTDTSGWITILLSGILSTLISIWYVQLRKRKPNGNTKEFFSYYVGKFLGSLLTILLFMYLIGTSYWFVIRTILLIKARVLEDASFLALLIMFLVPMYQLIKGGIRINAKFMEIVFPIYFLFFLFPLGLLKETDAHYLLPIIKEGWLPLFKALPVAFPSFVGIGIIIVIYPYLKEKEKAIKGVIIVNALSTFLFLFVTILSFTYYSPYEIINIKDPVLDILSGLEFEFIERLDTALFHLFIFVIASSCGIYLWLCHDTLSCFISERKMKWFIPIIFLCIISVSIKYIPTFKEGDTQRKVLSIIGQIFIIAYPFLLEIGGWFRKKRMAVKKG